MGKGFGVRFLLIPGQGVGCRWLHGSRELVNVHHRWANFQYLLISVILMSSLIAMLLQYMAAKLGIVSQMDLCTGYPRTDVEEVRDCAVDPD